MAILQMTTDVAGQINVNPRRVKIISTDNLATVTATGYLNNQNLFGNTIYPSDIIDMYYGWNTQTKTGTYEVFTVSMALSNGVMNINLVAWTNPGDVLLPVVSGNFAVFNGATGQIKDAGYLPSNVAKTNVVMATAATVTNNLVKATDTAGTIGDAGIVAANVVTNVTAGSLALPNAVNVAYPVIVKNITCGQAALATGSAVTIFASSGAQQYQILNIILNSGGTNFSGGGGNRLGQVTDGTNVYSVVPAATMQALTNSLWGSTAVAAPVSVPYDQLTAAGAPVTFKYSGGTTDYTAGSLVITVIAIQVA